MSLMRLCQRQLFSVCASNPIRAAVCRVIHTRASGHLRLIDMDLEPSRLWWTDDDLSTLQHAKQFQPRPVQALSPLGCPLPYLLRILPLIRLDGFREKHWSTTDDPGKVIRWLLGARVPITKSGSGRKSSKAASDSPRVQSCI